MQGPAPSFRQQLEVSPGLYVGHHSVQLIAVGDLLWAI